MKLCLEIVENRKSSERPGLLRGCVCITVSAEDDRHHVTKRDNESSPPRHTGLIENHFWTEVPHTIMGPSRIDYSAIGKRINNFKRNLSHWYNSLSDINLLSDITWIITLQFVFSKITGTPPEAHFKERLSILQYALRTDCIAFMSLEGTTTLRNSESTHC